MACSRAFVTAAGRRRVGAVDPLAHTLFGAGLAEAGLRRVSRYATATLLIGANAPDVDVIAAFWGEDTSLLFRRGWTHGVLALAVLPWIIAGGLLLFHRLRRESETGPPFRFFPLLAIAYLGVLSHPLLDWMNTYGVRVLMPFDERWFYGDALFIVDPWLWLLAAAGVVLARSRGRWSAAAWILLGCATSAMIFTQEVGVAARVVWVLAVAGIVATRLSSTSPVLARRVARGSLAVLVLYVAGMVAASRVARVQAIAWVQAQGADVENAYVSPVPANPLEREVVVATESHYHPVTVRWLHKPGVTPLTPEIPRVPRTPLIDAALEAPHVQGTQNWLRVPNFRIERGEEGIARVVIYDLRYDLEGSGGLGTRVVEIPAGEAP